MDVSRPRLAPLAAPYSPQIADWFARVMPPGADPLVLFRTLAVNERVFSRVMAGGLLDRGSLTLRQRELVIDRTTWLCGSEYEWGVHVAFFGDRVGFGEAEVRWLCAADPVETGFAGEEKLLLRMCDELHRTSTVGDALWRELSDAYSPEQLVELVVLAGFYHLISFATNAFALPPEPFAARFAPV
ncbi:MAG TPA: carboxymuconolactone decarboxylase family protein [Candidatus Binatia bacterium]|nr:carboxymuconolactone decarboxylase family protein [Candidatus Binatia bacterium]